MALKKDILLPSVPGIYKALQEPHRQGDLVSRDRFML